MPTFITRNIQILIVRGLFITLAFGGAIGVWNGIDLIKEFPFNIQIVLDALVIILFLLLAWRIPGFLPRRKNIVIIFLTLVWIYTLMSNALNLWSFVSALGFGETLSYTGTTQVMFVITQVTTLVLVPTILFALLWWYINRISTELR